MKKWGTITLMLFAFAVGFVSTYSCGGGSSAEAAGDADTLQGHPASDFAVVVHSHSGYATTSLLASHTHSEYMDAVGTCSNDQVLKWNGSMWVCGDDLDSSDSETLDGYDSSDFALSGHNHAGNSSTQYLSFSFLGGTESCTEPVYNFWETIDEYSQFANADTSVMWVGRSAVSGDPSWLCNNFIPVQLPDGAVVVDFGMLYYDETDGDPVIKAYLQRTMGDPNGMTIVQIKPSGASALPQYAWSTSVNEARSVIDNTRFGYHIVGNLWGGEPMALMSAFVGYVMP